VRNIKDKLRAKWLASRGFYAPDAGPVDDSPAAREENRQTTVPQKARKPYRMGDQPKRKKIAKRKALNSLFGAGTS
jgi:hypothetical protein